MGMAARRRHQSHSEHDVLACSQMHCNYASHMKCDYEYLQNMRRKAIY